jgi:hypothetical protein
MQLFLSQYTTNTVTEEGCHSVGHPPSNLCQKSWDYDVTFLTNWDLKNIPPWTHNWVGGVHPWRPIFLEAIDSFKEQTLWCLQLSLQPNLCRQMWSSILCIAISIVLAADQLYMVGTMNHHVHQRRQWCWIQGVGRILDKTLVVAPVMPKCVDLDTMYPYPPPSSPRRALLVPANTHGLRLRHTKAM